MRALASFFIIAVAALMFSYDGVAEGDETINLTLSSPTGGQFRGLTTAVLTISDPPPSLITEENTQRAVATDWLRPPSLRFLPPALTV
jgi:hypothetical protein